MYDDSVIEASREDFLTKAVFIQIFSLRNQSKNLKKKNQTSDTGIQIL